MKILPLKQSREGSCSLTPSSCLPKLFFYGAVILSVFTTYYVTGHFLDSDASSELVLAQHWIDSGTILSRDWQYGAELRILHMQLVYAPLLMLCDNWHIVRFLGAIIMQALYILSYGFLIVRSGLDRNIFYYSAALLLLPVSVVYGRIVLYHCHYLPNITVSFLIVGFLLGFARKRTWKSLKTYVEIFFLAGLSVLGGINSVRQLMITFAPLLLAIAVCYFVEDEKSEDPGKTVFFEPVRFQFLACTITAAFCSLVGLKINHMLQERGFAAGANPDANLVEILPAEELSNVISGYFNQFGYRNGVEMLSLSGLLSLSAIFVGAYLVWISVRRIQQHTHSSDIRRDILCTCFLFYTVVMVILFCVSCGNGGYYYYPLYLSLCYPWAVPLLLVHLQEVPKATHFLHVKKLFPWVAVLVLSLNGLANITYFLGSEAFAQPYEGLSFQDKDKKAHMAGAISYLTENGYDRGYGTYWESAVLTEITNGEIPMISMSWTEKEGTQEIDMEYSRCLTAFSFRTTPAEKPFVLITSEFQELFAQSDGYSYCTLVYTDDYHCIYDVLDVEGWIMALS